MKPLATNPPLLPDYLRDVSKFKAFVQSTLQLDRKQVSEFGLINCVEARLIKTDMLDYRVNHFCFNGFIARQGYLPKGSVITTGSHKTWHPYVISYGTVFVYDELQDTLTLVRALKGVPDGHFTSLTEPGTRRLLFVADDTMWTTFHPASHDDPNRLIEEIIAPNDNPLIN